MICININNNNNSKNCVIWMLVSDIRIIKITIIVGINKNNDSNDININNNNSSSKNCVIWMLVSDV